MGGIVDNQAIYVRITSHDVLPVIRKFAPFKAILVIDESSTAEWRSEVCKWLVDSGCRYGMTWGLDCSSWHDAIDWASLEGHDFNVPDDKFIMTTWHDDETLESVFWFAQFCAQFSYDEVELAKALILHIGRTDREEEMKALFRQSLTLADREPD